MSKELIVRSNPATHIAELRLNAPERLNAFDEVMAAALNSALDAIEKEPDIRVVLLTGEGRAFCAGANYKRHVSGDRTMYEKREYVRLLAKTCQHLYDFPKPIVVAAQGFVVGLGAEIALNCDFIIMSETAQFGLPEISIATFIGGGISKLLPRLVGTGRAKELIMLSDRIDGRKAHTWGLATRCVADDRLREEALGFASHLASRAPISVSLAKQIINTDCDYTVALDLEREAGMTCMMTDDWHEGVRSFAEKRAPQFKGR